MPKYNIARTMLLAAVNKQKTDEKLKSGCIVQNGSPNRLVSGWFRQGNPESLSIKRLSVF